MDGRMRKGPLDCPSPETGYLPGTSALPSLHVGPRRAFLRCRNLQEWGPGTPAERMSPKPLLLSLNHTHRCPSEMMGLVMAGFPKHGARVTPAAPEVPSRAPHHI